MSKPKHDVQFPVDFAEAECALCGREEELTEHHLIPRSRHNKARMLRRFTKDYMRHAKILVCGPCHVNLHRVLTEQELGESFNTLELITAHPDVGKFTSWIRKKPAGFRP